MNSLDDPSSCANPTWRLWVAGLFTLRFGKASQTSHERTILQRQIDVTDRQIDRLVCELNGLTDDEIAIVEAG